LKERAKTGGGHTYKAKIKETLEEVSEACPGITIINSREQ
jgi:hypothetical protein